MPIPVSCRCGKQLRAPDSAVGKKIRCPGCKELLAVAPVRAAAPARQRVEPAREEPDETPVKRKKRKKDKGSGGLASRRLIIAAVAGVLLLGVLGFLFLKWDDIKISGYLGQLASTREADRAEGEERLRALGPKAKAHLLEALSDGRSQVRAGVVWILVKMDLDPAEFVPRLGTVVRDDSSLTVRKEAAAALASLGPRARAAVPSLLQAAGKSDDEVARAVCTTLIVLKEPQVAPVLLSWLKKPDVELRAFALTSLGALGPVSKEIAPAMTAALTDIDVPVSTAALVGLSQVAPSAELLARCVKNVKNAREHVDIRKASATALGHMGKKDPAAITALIDALQVEDVMGEAAEALGDIGPPAVAAYRPLLEGKMRVPRLAAIDYQTRASNYQSQFPTTTTTNYDATGRVVGRETTGPPPIGDNDPVFGPAVRARWLPVERKFEQALAKLAQAGAGSGPAEAVAEKAVAQAERCWQAAQKQWPTGPGAFPREFLKAFPAWKPPAETETLSVDALADVVLARGKNVPIAVIKKASHEQTFGYHCRAGAAMLLAQRGAGARAALPRLVEALVTDNNSNVVVAVAAALHAISPGPMVADLAKKAGRDDHEFRGHGFAPVTAIEQANAQSEALSAPARKTVTELLRAAGR